MLQLNAKATRSGRVGCGRLHCTGILGDPLLDSGTTLKIDSFAIAAVAAAINDGKTLGPTTLYLLPGYVWHNGQGQGDHGYWRPSREARRRAKRGLPPAYRRTPHHGGPYLTDNTPLEGADGRDPEHARPMVQTFPTHVLCAIQGCGGLNEVTAEVVSRALDVCLARIRKHGNAERGQRRP